MEWFESFLDWAIQISQVKSYFVFCFLLPVLIAIVISIIIFVVRTNEKNYRPPFSSAKYINDSKVHLLLAASGSVATIKIPMIVRALSTYADVLSIRIILTPSAEQFLQGQSSEQPTVASLLSIPGVDGICTDEDEWKHPWSRSGAGGSVPILHIELRKWADLMVIAPLSANTMAKIVAGQSDGLLTSVVRAWDTDGVVDGLRPLWREVWMERQKERGVYSKGRKEILVAPAMNTAMFRQPVTKKHLKVLNEEWGGENGWIEVLSPDAKLLACGDVGEGAMMEWSGIVEVIKERMFLDK